jgi:hypothetical protein
VGRLVARDGPDESSAMEGRRGRQTRNQPRRSGLRDEARWLAVTETPGRRICDRLGGVDRRGRIGARARIGYSSVRASRFRPGGDTAATMSGLHADVAQLVEHHLAKVRVAGSNPVVRSEVPGAVLGVFDDTARLRSVWLCRHLGRPARAAAGGGMAEWLRQGPAKPCTRVRFPLPPLRAVSSAGERFPDTEEVTGSIPVPPTTSVQVAGQFRDSGTGLLDHLSVVRPWTWPRRAS